MLSTVLRLGDTDRRTLERTLDAGAARHEADAWRANHGEAQLRISL
jgi:hypothetical protein